MKLAIFTGGHIDNGLWSSVSGEGRWALNLVDSFIKYIPEIEIDLFNDSKPQWGIQPPVKNINLKSLSEISNQILYDAAIYVPLECQLSQDRKTNWHKCKTLTNHLKSKLYIHNNFSWTTGLLEYPCLEENHILVFPFLESRQTFDEGSTVSKFTYRFLPYPHASEYQFPGINRTELLWPSKEVFHPAFVSRSTHIPESGVEALKALNNLVKKYQVSSINFFAAHSFDPDWTPLVNQLGITELINTLPNSKLFNWLTYDQVQKIILRSKIAIPIAGLAASFTECVCLGCLPLVSTGYILSDIAKKNGVLLSSSNTTQQEYYDLLDLYMRDNQIYQDHLFEYQEAMEDHLQINVAKRFLNLLEEFKVI